MTIETTTLVDPALGPAVHRLLRGDGRMPRILGLGEPRHGEDEFGRLRNLVFGHLVEHAGYRTIALESDAWAGRLVDAWVRGGPGTEGDVLAHGFSHGFGTSAANRALLRWARDHNAGRPADDQVRVTGFDAPVEISGADSPRAALAHLYSCVDGLEELPCSWSTLDRLLGADEPWTDRAAMLDPARSVGGEDRVRELRTIADDLSRTLACAAPVLRRTIGPDALDEAELAARTATGLLAHHAAMARPAGDRYQRLCALRDLMMADNLEALARRGPVLAFANNQHLRTGAASMPFGDVTIDGITVPPMTLWWQPAGALLAARLGGGYAVVGTAVGRAEHLGIGEPDPGTAERVLYDRTSGNQVISAAALRELRAGRPRRSGDVTYFPLDDTLLGELDAVLWVREIAARPAP